MSSSIKITSIYELIDLIKVRPGMYIGDNKISTLYTFLGGYQFASMVHNIEDEKVFPPFWYFHDWVKEKFNWFESTAGWKNIILEENNFDEEKALMDFFRIIDEFRKLQPIRMQRAVIEKSNIDFHHSGDCTVKFGDGKPIYEKADQVFLIEFSHNFGFSYFIKFNYETIGLEWTERFKSELAAKDKTEKLFGTGLRWNDINGSLKELTENIIKNKAAN